MVAWAAICALFLLWQAVQYRGIMSLFAEWQFHAFGSYYPSVTYAALVTIVLLPGMALFGRARRRRTDQRVAAATLRSATVFRRLLFGVSAAGAAGAIVRLLLILFLPNSAGQPQHIDLSQPLIALPREGATMIDGSIAYGLTAAFDEDLLIVRHNQRFAPIAAGSDTHDLQFFVALPPDSDVHAQVADASMTGILRKNALPGEIVQLYRYGGYRVEEPYYVLFADDAAVRWPHLKIAAHFGLLAILFLLVGLLQHRRIRQLENAEVSVEGAEGQLNPTS